MPLADDTVTASFQADSRQELLGAMQVIHDVLPLSLSLAFPDPFTVATTAADAGSARIIWQVANTGSSAIPRIAPAPVFASLPRGPPTA